MPRKPTKLRFFGVAVRRRTLYALTLLFAVASVPTVSWAVLVLQANLPQMQRYGFYAAAILTLFPTFCGWLIITRQNIILYRSEARVIWPSAAVLLAAATWAACNVAASFIAQGKMAYGTPLAFGGVFMLFLLVRCCLLGRHPRRSDIVRGESGPPRRKSHPPIPGHTPSPLVPDQAGLDGEPQEADDVAEIKPDA